MLSNLLQDKGEFELKYTFPNVMSPAMASWLSMNCKIDKEYPESRIQSIYLETLNTESYFKKINSDFFHHRKQVLPTAPVKTWRVDADHYPISVDGYYFPGSVLSLEADTHSTFKHLLINGDIYKNHQVDVSVPLQGECSIQAVSYHH
jgi:hypothetical protein